MAIHMFFTIWYCLFGYYCKFTGFRDRPR